MAAESAPQLQHTVRSLTDEGAPARVPQLLVLVVSLAITGHGEAFLRLKVLPLSLHEQCLLGLHADLHTEQCMMSHASHLAAPRS